MPICQVIPRNRTRHMANNQSPQEGIELLIAEYILAEEQGQAVSTETFIEQHPEYAEELKEFFQLHRGMQSGMQPSVPPAGATQDVLQQSGQQSTSRLPKFDSSPIGNVPFDLGDYKVLEEIDRGGMGVVYRARHKPLDRTVALKVIRSGELARQEEIDRFLSEAEAAAGLSHPGIVPIYEVGTMHGLVFYTMAYIEGKSLAQLVERKEISPLDAVEIVHKLCNAVDYAHSRGVYHRDLKPANVLVNPQGQPIIIDFGLAKMDYRNDSLTATGQILGTPAYMAPEYAAGKCKSVGPELDVYSLGAILYCLCAGQPAFTGPSPFDVLMQVLDRRPALPSKLNKQVTSQIDYVCMRSLEKEPAERYCTAKELAKDLERIIADQPIDVPKINWSQRLSNWWQREPTLVAHVAGIGATTLIVLIAHLIRGEESQPFPYRMLLLLGWLVLSYALQFWVNRSPARHLPIVCWLSLDVFIYTTLITFAAEPRSVLLVGYPMMIVASSLFYQRRFVFTTTVLSCLGFVILGLLFPKSDFPKWDFSLIFLCGLAVICLCLLSIIRRVRGLSRFYDHNR